MARRPFRYTLILASVALGAVLAAAGGWRYARASAPLSGPIIIVSIDALRADHLPAYGYRQVQTPAITQLAADGVVFTRAYSHTPQTLPAHVALLSGRLPFETGVRDDVGMVVKAGERLLPQMLRERGYTTAGVVSASLLRKETGIAQGFDFFDDAMPASPDELAGGSTERDGIESEHIAEHWLEGTGTSRAFLFLHLYEPHKPYVPLERFAQYSPYDGEIAYADEIVGHLIRFLKTHQLYDRSTIVLLSGHGEGLGDHGEQEHGLFIYDETIHVPLIVKQEGNAGAGRRVPDLVQHIDVVPTILDLVKAPVPGNLRGRSLKALLDDTGHLPEAAVYSEAYYSRYHFGWSELTAVTSERYQYIKAPREEMYDLARDPHERTNIADTQVEIRRALNADLIRIMGSAAVSPLTEPSSAGVTDPKDQPAVIESYRRAMALTGDRKWSETIGLLQGVLRVVPDAPEVWSQLATVAVLLNRYDVALDAYQHITTLEPTEPSSRLGAASVLFRERKFEDARAEAAEVLEITADKNLAARAAAHEMLARIALARHDPDTARAEAALVQQADPSTAVPAFIEGRILYDQGKYEDALPLFEQAIAEGKKAAAPLFELHFYAGDTLEHVDRPSEAEAELAEEIRDFPQNLRARASLATLYHTTDQPEAADGALTDMLRACPTTDAYALAAKLWKSFGKPHQADATRAEARRLFNDAHH